MLDRYNHLYEAWPDKAAPGRYELNTQPIAKLGAGRYVVQTACGASMAADSTASSAVTHAYGVAHALAAVLLQSLTMSSSLFSMGHYCHAGQGLPLHG